MTCSLNDYLTGSGFTEREVEKREDGDVESVPILESIALDEILLEEPIDTAAELNRENKISKQQKPEVWHG